MNYVDIELRETQTATITFSSMLRFTLDFRVNVVSLSRPSITQNYRISSNIW